MLAGKERVAHIAHRARTRIVEHEFQLALLSRMLQLFPTRDAPRNDVTDFRHRDECVGIVFADNQSKRVGGNHGLLSVELIVFQHVQLVFRQFARRDGAANAVSEKHAYRGVFTAIDRLHGRGGIQQTEGFYLLFHNVAERFINCYMHIIGSPPSGGLPMITTTRGGKSYAYRSY